MYILCCAGVEDGKVDECVGGHEEVGQQRRHLHAEYTLFDETYFVWGYVLISNSKFPNYKLPEDIRTYYRISYFRTDILSN
jgi:hypothetical protein